MDPLDFLDNEDLLSFFHGNKTKMSCMEDPYIFLSQLRDRNLIPEDRYKKISRMKSKDNIKKALYELLDWLETERPEHIREFWTCVFMDIIMNEYPTIRSLHRDLRDGSYRFDRPLPEEVKETDQAKRNKLSDGTKEEQKKAKKKTKQSCSSRWEEMEEHPHSSSPLTPRQREKSKKVSTSSPLKKGEKTDIWNVTCGTQEGRLYCDRLAKAEECIKVKKKWFTPPEFLRFAGRESSKNWKKSIRYKNIPLEKLIKDGLLKSGRYTGRRKSVRA